MLELENVTKSYRTDNPEPVAALAETNLKLEPGTFASVQGPSGCGKSTLLLTAGLLMRPDSGRVLLNGEDAFASARDHRASLRRRLIGFVFQQFHLIPYLGLLDNIRLPDTVESEEEGESRARELARTFGLTHRLDHTPGELSVGERQRVALARALYANPTLILADEPTGNLDAESSSHVLDGLADFAEKGGVVLMVTHDASAADRATRQFKMNNGILS